MKLFLRTEISLSLFARIVFRSAPCLYAADEAFSRTEISFFCLRDVFRSRSVLECS